MVETRRAAQEQRTEPILKILEQVEGIARQTPPIDNKASRFGNPAFRTFYDEIEKVSRWHDRLPREDDGKI